MGVAVPVGENMVVLRWSLAGDNDEMLTTFGVRDIDQTDPVVTAQRVHAAATAAGSITPSAQILVGWQFNGVTVYKQDDLGQIIGAHNVAITNGGGAPTSLPQNCSLLVHKFTNSSGRRNRGRFFVPPFCLVEGEVSNTGAIGGSALDLFTDQWSQFLDNLLAAPMDPVLFHEDGGPSTPITAFVPDGVIATQRRRLR